MKIVAALLALLLSGPALASKPYSVQNLILLQPDFVLGERVQVDDLSDYIKSVNAAAEASLGGVAKPTPAAGFIVVAVRPGGQSKVWLDFSPALSSAVGTRLRASLERVTPFKANGGVVVFAINSTLWGAPATGRQVPSPAEWQEAMNSADGPMEIGRLVERMWPPNAGT